MEFEKPLNENLQKNVLINTKSSFNEDSTEKKILLAKTFVDFSISTFNMALSYIIDIVPISLTYLQLRPRNDDLLLSTFGFGLSYLNLTLAFLYGFTEYFGVEASKCIGQKNYKRFTLVLFKTILSMYLLSFISIFLILNSNNIMRLFGIDEKLRNSASFFVKINLLERILDLGTTLLRGVMISQNFHKIFLPVNFFNVILFMITSYIFITILELDLIGYAISRLIKTVVEFFIIFYYFKKYSNREIVFLPKFSDITKNFFRTFKKSFITLLAIWGEVLSLEMTSIFIAGLNNLVKTASWVSFINIVFYNLFLSLGMSNTIRTNIGILRGKRNPEKMFKMIQSYCIYAYSISIVCSFACFFFANKIAYIFTQNPEVIGYLVSYLKIYSFFLCFYLLRNCWNTILRIMDFNTEQFIIGGVFFPILILTLSCLSIYVFNFGVYGVLISFLMSDALVNVILIYYYFSLKDQFAIKMKDEHDSLSFN